MKTKNPILTPYEKEFGYTIYRGFVFLKDKYNTRVFSLYPHFGSIQEIGSFIDIYYPRVYTTSIVQSKVSYGSSDYSNEKLERYIQGMKLALKISNKINKKFFALLDEAINWEE